MISCNEEANTEIEITNALRVYPQILTNWQGDADEIKYLHLTVINFEWTGETHYLKLFIMKYFLNFLSYDQFPQTFIVMNYLLIKLN